MFFIHFQGPILTENNIDIEPVRNVLEDGVNDTQALEPVHANPQAAEGDRQALPQAAGANKKADPQAAGANREADPRAARANRENIPAVEVEIPPRINTVQIFIFKYFFKFKLMLYVNILFQGLEAFLKKNSEGKAVLKAYNESLKKKLPLKRTVRARLVRLIIKREKDRALKNVEVDNALEKFV